MPDKTIPLVSCITTTYKKFEYIYETLASVLKQDYPNIEIIIGDDGSPDFPEEDIRQYIEKNKSSNITNVIIHHEYSNHGTVYNCALCRELASGEYIMGIASDDQFYDSQVVSDVVKYFEDTGAEVVTCIRQLMDTESRKELAVLPSKKQQNWLRTLSPEEIYEKMVSFPFISGSSTYYRKEFYQRMGKYDTSYKYIEDVPFYMKILRKGEKIHFFPRKTIKYQFGGGISTTPNRQNPVRKMMYKDRIHYMEQEVLPYADDMSWWRKEHIKVRTKRFLMEARGNTFSIFELYRKLFCYSPVGTAVQIYYQISYRKSLKLYKNKKWRDKI